MQRSRPFYVLEMNYIYLVQRGLIDKIYSVKRIFRCPFHISGFEKNDITLSSALVHPVP